MIPTNRINCPIGVVDQFNLVIEASLNHIKLNNIRAMCLYNWLHVTLAELMLCGSIANQNWPSIPNLIGWNNSNWESAPRPFLYQSTYQKERGTTHWHYIKLNLIEIDNFILIFTRFSFLLKLTVILFLHCC